MAYTTHYAHFNDFNIASVPGVDILAIDAQGPRKTLSILQLANSDKRKLSTDYYTARTINVRVCISQFSRSLAERTLDELLSRLQGKEKRLVIPQGAGARRYTATLGTVTFIVSGGSYIEANLPFECADAYGYDTDYTVLVNLTGKTDANRTDAISVSGSARTQAPFIEFKLTALSNGTDKAVTIGNANTGQAITVTRTWSQFDLLQIDCAESTVKVNEVEVAFSGAFPEFTTGSGSIYLTNAITGSTFNYFVYYYKRYA